MSKARSPRGLVSMTMGIMLWGTARDEPGRASDESMGLFSMRLCSFSGTFRVCCFAFCHRLWGGRFVSVLQLLVGGGIGCPSLCFRPLDDFDQALYYFAVQ